MSSEHRMACALFFLNLHLCLFRFFVLLLCSFPSFHNPHPPPLSLFPCLSLPIKNNILITLNKNPRTVNPICCAYLLFLASSSSIFPTDTQKKKKQTLKCRDMQGHLCENKDLCFLGAFTTNIGWYFYGNKKKTRLYRRNSSWKANANWEWGEEDEQMDKLVGRQTERQRVIASPHHF